MRIEIVSRATFSPPAQHRMFKAAKETIGDFFRLHDGQLEEVHLLAFRAVHGGDPRCRIKITTKTPDMGHNPKGVPVVVFLEGKQGLTCLMTTVPEQNDEQIQKLIEAGPYLRKKRLPKLSEAPVTSETPLQGGEASELLSTAETIMEAAKFEPEAAEQREPAEAPVAKPVLPASPPPKRMTPLEKLTENEVGSEEI